MEITLERTIAHYTAAALTFVKAPRPEIVAGLQQDIADIDAFFVQYAKPETVSARVYRLG